MLIPATSDFGTRRHTARFTNDRWNGFSLCNRAAS
jgi:hypothetical protein